jgi:transcriptional regulator with XRE-family HTH domain
MEANKIRDLRVQAGLSRFEASLLLNCSVSTIIKWELGLRKPLRKSLRPLQERAVFVDQCRAAAYVKDLMKPQRLSKAIKLRESYKRANEMVLPDYSDRAPIPITGAIPTKPISLYDQLDKES